LASVGDNWSYPLLVASSLFFTTTSFISTATKQMITGIAKPIIPPGSTKEFTVSKKRSMK
jgi:hypothetical protein